MKAAFVLVSVLLVGNGFASSQADVAPRPAKPNEEELRKSWDKFLQATDSQRVAKDYPKAIQNLKSAEADQQVAGLATLSATGEIEVIPWIVPLLDAPDARVRIHAALALDKLVSGLALKRRGPPYDRVVLKPLGPKDPDLRPLAWVVLQMLKKPDNGNTHAYAATMIRYLELKDFEIGRASCRERV